MPFALVPDGFTLKKVTKMQQEAINSYNNSLTSKAFFEGPASAELVKAVAIVVTPIVLAVLAEKKGSELLDAVSKGLSDLVPDLDLSSLDLSEAGVPSV
jgi:hypothetical protein